MLNKKYKYLEFINFPSDIRALKLEELPLLCEEIRHYIIETTAKNPGHLGSSLGTVELTVALHYVFNTPDDKLVWDVGHQAYAHKIITGRKAEFVTNRQYKGISGFPRMSESVYDAFGTGHSSTSISAALGMAVASNLDGEQNRKHIAVVGDAAICSGEAFEAMNHAGSTKANLLIILNDNRIAIDVSVGAMRNYFLRITASPSYNRFKNKLWNLLTGQSEQSNRITHLLQRMGNVIKSLLFQQSNFFQSMGFRYFGPVNGHDIRTLVKILSNLKKIHAPIVLHALTVKGKGLAQAEQHQTQYHAPGQYNPETGEIVVENQDQTPLRYQDVFGHTLVELAKQNPNIVGITPAMATGCSLDKMMSVIPERAFDVGIAEQHAVTFAAGLAAQGKLPYCNIYSSFFQRAIDQLIHDVTLQKLSVVFCLDRAGLVGEDGATHHGVFDMALLRSVPNLIIASPLNEPELRNMLYSAQFVQNQAIAIRYPRGKGVTLNWETPFESVTLGTAKVIQKGRKIAVLSFGTEGQKIIRLQSRLEAQNISITHVDMRFLKPLDEVVLHEICQNHAQIITVENGMLIGGLASATAEFIVQNNYSIKLKSFGIADHFVEHGKISELEKQQGFDEEAILAFILECA